MARNVSKGQIIMRFGILAVLILLVGNRTVGAAPDRSIRVTAHLTADNYYGLYFGDGAATTLTLVGLNSPADTWETPETWVFDMPADNYFYVVAWDELGPGGGYFRGSMWIGDFSSRRGVLVSAHNCWQSMRIPAGWPGPNGTPNTDDIKAAMATGTWSTPSADAFSLPGFYWGQIQGVSPDARHLWIDPLWGSNAPYVVFRAPIGGCK